jgi:hypothetical protein
MYINLRHRPLGDQNTTELHNTIHLTLYINRPYCLQYKQARISIGTLPDVEGKLPVYAA